MRFSIITATCNSEKTVEHTVRSVMRQELADIEHIIVDNCSSDNTLKIISDCKSPFVKVICEADKGIYDAFNKGLKAASGEVISFLNSDDYYLKDALKKVSNVFSKDKDAVCVHGNIQVNNRTVKPVKGFSSFGGRRIFHPASFMRRTVFDVTGNFDTQFKITSDLDLFLRIPEFLKFVYIDAPLTSFALGGISTQKLFSVPIEIKNVLLKNNYPSRLAYLIFLIEVIKNIKSITYRRIFS
ncbi:MAG: hypothetical protein UT30_C0017G0029 [Candidatus Uhrbacteria bacterium GW2011_GWF2_39_13]|uniref:Glycosyltransferase 2-like domain-containing protein n=1 Tax=Candidatus Uhrbacteria bacterium GW2011_GWF2_39_13 TaxID=1618995 RepID=A0A0G0Q0F0_9BACT|nr:MAG: hypothetical protein UT30_C0017G0029 [Candidatus Uhrbacteria bacterium GW2011_GWF2_39_13]